MNQTSADEPGSEEHHGPGALDTEPATSSGRGCPAWFVLAKASQSRTTATRTVATTNGQRTSQRAIFTTA
jgi:hypothetical protein